MFEHTQNWIERTRLLRSARHTLRRSKADVNAAQALWVLNRLARASRHYHEPTYSLKPHILRIFWQKGYLIRVSKQRQTFTCWNCGGTGHDEDWDSTCHKCGGDGIYCEHMLYLFTFGIDGHLYMWHQPTGFAPWAMDLTRNTFEADITQYEPLPLDTSELEFRLEDVALLYEYCRMNGIPESELPWSLTLPESLKWDIKDIYREEVIYGSWKGGWREWVYQLDSRICEWKRRRKYKGTVLEDIPF